MNLLTDKRGALSWVRVSILIAVLGVLLIGGGLLSFVLDQQSRSAPLMIDLPPGAQPWGSPRILGSDWQQMFWRVPGGDVESVASYYQGLMRSFYGGVEGEPGSERCQRLPPVGEFTNQINQPNGVFDSTFVPGESLPVLWKCLFDRSGFNNSQTTEVWIYPGQPDSDSFMNSQGDVVIRHEQRWQS